MLDNWNTQRLAIPRLRQDTYALESGTQTYTMGRGGDFDAARPLKIERANIVVTSDSEDQHRKLEVIEAQCKKGEKLRKEIEGLREAE